MTFSASSGLHLMAISYITTYRKSGTGPMATRKSGKKQLKSIDLELASPVAATTTRTWLYCALWQLKDGDDSVFLCSTTILISAAGRASSYKARLLHWDLQLPLPQLINQRQRPVIDLAEITAVNCCNFKCSLILMCCV